MDKEKIKRVEWFLNFLNVDLENIHFSDKLKWIVEVLNVICHGYHDVIEQAVEEKYLKRPDRSFLAPPKLEKDFDSYGELYEALREGSKLKQLQSYIKKYFTDFIDNLNQEILQRKEWTSVRPAGIEYLLSVPLAQFESLVQITADFPPMTSVSELELLPVRKTLRNDSVKIKREILDKIPIRMSFHAPKYEDTLLFYLFQALDGIKIGALRKCPECSSLYLHISKKKKIFCSNRCAARKASRDKRRRIKEKKPELYEQMKEKAKERAHKSYKRKQKAINPGAKVQRRPRKKTE